MAHRLATIKNVDQILVFKNGEIIERGTHEDLLNLKSAFYKMIQNQQIQQQTKKNILKSWLFIFYNQITLSYKESVYLNYRGLYKSSVYHKTYP